MNIFYFYGEEPYLINNELKKIIDRNPNSKLINFELDYKINDVLNEISTFSLFENSKIIIFNNLPLLVKKDEKEINEILNAIKFVPENTKLIFTLEKNLNEKNSKNKLVDYLKKNANCVEFKKLTSNEILNLTKNKLNELEVQISEMDLFYLLTKIPNKISIIFNEIEKLSYLNKKINKQMIDDLIPKYDLNNAFDFINAFHNHDTELIFKIYYEKINQGESIQSLIGQIASVLEICSKIYSYKQMKYNDDQIAKELNKHIFVIKKNEEFLNVLTYKKVNKYLKELAILDSNIKRGLVEEKIGFERFLLEMIK